MRLLLYVLPVAFLVAYSQLVVKWRAQLGGVVSLDKDFIHKLVGYFSDGYILSAYATALLGSFLWLVVVSRIPLSIGFPVYIGVTFLMVMVGSWLFLGEPVSVIRMAAATLILAGIVLGATES
ncbi:hypothetical protein RO575_16410 [Methylomonas sp. MO1]|uniref:hypothetical protein n=1 Tax=unclassified Methylomonas TaxID=2608980 RepID=UPI000479B39D|nr:MULTISPECIES: hypothetical protein [unclassified Methylomonas]MDT4291151.1 hypothetical protein [Methylomonas sp. MO1]